VLQYTVVVFGLVCFQIIMCCFDVVKPFTAEVAIMRLLGSAPKSHVCDQRRRSKVTGLSDLMTLFIEKGVYIAKRRKEHSMFSKTR
jgi:hypothetical protein